MNIDLSKITIDDFNDSVIIAHGLMPYNRDYYFHIETLWKDNNAGQYLVRFKHCYEVNIEVTANAKKILESWDDCFINYQKWINAGEPPGYVWGTNSIMAYPGFSIIKDSKKAEKWTKKIGKKMEELFVEAEIFQISLIFHSWEVKKLNNKTNLIRKLTFPLE